MVKLCRERGMICPRFVAVDSFFPCAFLFLCYSKNNPTIPILLSLLNALLNGVRVLTEYIATFSKARTDSRGLSLLGLNIIGALCRKLTLFLRMGETVVVLRRDGNLRAQSTVNSFASSTSLTETSLRRR